MSNEPIFRSEAQIRQVVFDGALRAGCLFATCIATVFWIMTWSKLHLGSAYWAIIPSILAIIYLHHLHRPAYQPELKSIVPKDMIDRAQERLVQIDTVLRARGAVSSEAINEIRVVLDILKGDAR